MKKGELSKNWIIEHSIHILNEYGLDITLQELAKFLNISRGRINHFFPTKDSLFVEIGTTYQDQLNLIKTQFKFSSNKLTINDLELLFSELMDNQYKYRCSILYVAGSSNSRKEMLQHIHNSFNESVKGVRVLVEWMIHSELVIPGILEDSKYKIFEFQFTNLFTSWVISKEVYHRENSYESMKPIYLAGLLNLFDPYLVKESCSHSTE